LVAYPIVNAQGEQVKFMNYPLWFHATLDEQGAIRIDSKTGKPIVYPASIRVIDRKTGKPLLVDDNNIYLTPYLEHQQCFDEELELVCAATSFQK
jgi:hypothetical protein